jgi:heme-degrading monooxygenase HmoA
MILEVAILDIRPGSNAEFESAFQSASPLIAASDGYLGHELQLCMERASRYVLLVRWRTLEDHIVGFRGSARYQEWRQLLHHFYEPFPVVEHFVQVGAWTPEGADVK